MTRLKLNNEHPEVARGPVGPRFDGFPVLLKGVKVAEAAMDGHVAAVAQLIKANVGTKWLAVVFAVAVHAFSLAATAACFWGRDQPLAAPLSIPIASLLSLFSREAVVRFGQAKNLVAESSLAVFRLSFCA